MRISSINLYKKASINRNILNNKNTVKFEQNIDIFKKQKQTFPSKEFKKAIANSPLGPEIVENLFISKDGKYLKDVEDDFVNWVNSYREAYIKHTNKKITPKDEQFITEIMYAIFSTLKNGDKVEINEAEMNFLFDIIAESLKEQNKSLPSLIKSSKVKGKMDTLLLQASIEFSRFYANVLSPFEIKYLMMNYCLDENGDFSQEKYEYFSTLSLCLGSVDKEKLDEVQKLIVDKEGNIDPEKFNFVCSVFEILSDCIDAEYSEEEIIKLKNDLIDAKLMIAERMAESSIKPDGDYDSEKALNSFMAWYKYVLNNQNLVSHNIIMRQSDSNTFNVKSLAEVLSDPNYELSDNPLGHNSTLYLLLCALFDESVFKG